MKLNDALKRVADARALPVGRRVALVCAFEPLHLKTFLEAHYAQRSAADSETRLELELGVYGDLEGNLGRVASSACDAVAIAFEWGDLDPRLGVRSVGAWSGPIYDVIVRDVSARLDRMAAVIERITEHKPVTLCPPTIPLTFAGWTAGTQHSPFELALQQALAAFVFRVARSPRALIVHPARLDALSPVAERHDPRMELAAGFPYRLAHASAVAELLVVLLSPPAPKKALITDLDDTLWAGIVGEVGADGVSWTQAENAQLHGLYQLVLRQLADMGVLLGVASKNEPDTVHAALARKDLWLDGASLFPVHASWSPKSQSVSAILRAWNIAAEDTVFVDDSAMELDEVRRSHPGLECVIFPRSDPRAALRFFELLRDLFGRSVVSRDDALRTASLRASAAFEADKGGADDHAIFIQQLQGVVTFRRQHAVDVRRAVQLLNKTNQFNLNGERVGDNDFSRLLDDAHSLVLEAAYADRYGALGVVGLVAARREPERLVVLHWVLSCRAFSRRVEHHMLRALFDAANGLPVELAFQRTARNGPVQLFLEQLGVPHERPGPLVLAPSVESALVGALVLTWSPESAMDEIEQKVLACFSGVFPDVAPAELRALAQDTHAAWDSVAHVTLIAALGEAFECDFDFEGFAEAMSFEGVLAQVNEQLSRR